MYRLYLFISCFIVLKSVIEGSSCTKPTFETQSYSTKETVTAAVPQYAIQFTVKCASGTTGPNLYAAVNNNVYQVSRSGEGNSFQVSWGGAANQLGAGSQTVTVYDEEGYQALKKVERSGGDQAEVKSLGSLEMNHQAVWKGPMVSSEVMACIVMVAVFYVAYTQKSQILS